MSNGLVSLLAAGADENEKLVSEIYDVQDDILDTKKLVMERSGVYSQSEINDYVKEGQKENDAGRKSDMAAAKKATKISIGVNLVGATVSTVMAAGVAGKGVSKVASKISKKFGKESTEAIVDAAVDNTVKNVVKNATKEGTEAAVDAVVDNAAKQVTKNTIKSTLGKIAVGTGKGVKAAVTGTYNLGGKIAGTSFKHIGWKAAGIAAPFLVTQGVTRYVNGKKNDELSATLDAATAAYDYLNEHKEEFVDGLKEDAEQYLESYNNASSTLLSQYTLGEISQAEYDKKVEEMCNRYNTEFSRMKEEFPEMLDENAYAAALERAGKNEYDLNDLTENSTWLAQMHEEHPDMQEYVETYQDAKNGTAKSEFGSFWKTINSTIIKYVPAVAYAEAVVVKAADSTFDFIRDMIKGKNEKSKYQNDSITDIAKAIIGNSEEHLAVKEKASEAMGSLQESVVTMDDFSEKNTTTVVSLESEYNKQEQEFEQTNDTVCSYV